MTYSNQNKKTKIVSCVKKDSIWGSYNFLQFKVSKIIKKSGKIWIHYHLRENPKQKYCCYEEAFLSRFYQLTNLN